MRLKIGLLTTLLSLSVSPTLANAQVSADTTLPNNTIVTPAGAAFQITGGTTVGSNLFHSFSDFSLNAGEAALFFNTPAINNIFSRVTGNNISTINGSIQVQNPVNFYLLNPNGILFGPNASLNIGGSFFASTADSLIFADGTEFSATSPTTSPLLTLTVPTALQFGGSPGNITVQGTGHNLQPRPGGAVISFSPATQLNGTSGQTIALVGGQVNLEGGNVIAREGEIEIGSVGSNERVAITSDLNLDYTGVSTFRAINLTQKASIDASGSGGGRIHLQGREINVSGGSNILSITEGGNAGVGVTVNASESVNLVGTDNTGVIPSGILTETIPLSPGGGSGGRLEVNAPQLSITDGAQVSSSSFSQGQAGDIVINSSSLDIQGKTPLGFPSGIFAATVGVGAGGNVTINSEQMTLQDGVRVESTTRQVGKQPAGDLTITTQTLLVEGGSQVSTSTSGGGNAGELRIEADNIHLRGAGEQASGLFSQVNSSTATGQGGNLTLETQQLQIEDGAQISAGTFGQGDGGVVDIRAFEEIEIEGRGRSRQGEPLPSGIFTQVGEQARGEGGDIRVQTPRLTVRSGSAVSAGTLGIGNGGTVTVDASEWVEIQGENTGIAARTRGSADAGDVSITSPKLIISNQGSATVESLGTGDAGDLQISSDFIDLNQGRMTGETTSGQGGNLTITGRDLRLLNNSLISTTAGTEDQPGDGGNITITTDTLTGLQNSDITANSFRGRGGQINITAEGIFGLEVREELTPNNDITAFSLFDPSLNGEVNLRTPDIDPTQGLTDVPTIESPEQVTEVCPERADNEANELTTAGRGLPTDPTAPLGESEILVEPIAPVTETGEGINSSPPLETTGREVLVAQDWYINEQGQLILTEMAVNLSPRSSLKFPVRCQERP